ncbi:MAG TPA: flagellar protein FlgN [Acetivibrio sp.]|jgi:flagellar biosynthesis/type III secretory pathway chaperone|nr:flagellar protein FlgN [Clostridium sp.]HQA58846.1 flagellar protein FlgN [Acetivibrio sp.]
MNNQLINDLIDILEKELKIYEDILEISKNKTDIIVKGKVKELENITELEQSFIAQIGKLEAAREDLVDKICSDIGKDSSKNITVTELMGYIEASQAERLNSYKENMVSLLKEIKDKNDLNAKLIKSSIDYIDFSINIMSNVSVEGNNYSGKAQINDSEKKTYFDVKL